MFGRVTRLVALAAIGTHLWVNLVVVPLHHLVAHRLPAVTSSEQEVSSPVHHCSCRHHANCGPNSQPASQTAQSSPNDPLSPDDADDCPICQIFTQPIAPLGVPAPILSPERFEFSAPIVAIQSVSGVLFDPVSRGPPLA